MKITEVFPTILQALYNNCNYELKVDITIEDTFAELVPSSLSPHKKSKQLQHVVNMNFFYQCYFYMVSAEYLTDHCVGSINNRTATLTSKAIDFLEQYKSQF